MKNDRARAKLRANEKSSYKTPAFSPFNPLALQTFF